MNQATVTTTKLSNHTDILATNTAPTFIIGGNVTADLGHYSSNNIYTSVSTAKANLVTVQADGKILLSGSIESGVYAPSDGESFLSSVLMRYNTDGSLDTGFGSDGKITATLEYAQGGATLSFNALNTTFSNASVQTDGKLLLVGGFNYYDYDYNDYFYDFALARYNIDGSLDVSFDGDGKVTTDVSEYDSGQLVSVQADGKILLGGTSGSSYLNRDFSLVRYNTDGSLDLSFNADGIVTTHFGGGVGNSIIVQADGKILLGGESSGNFTLMRYNTDGSLDISFGNDGKITTNLGGSVYVNSIAVQADGKILLGGTSYKNFALVRYNTDGSLDLSFDSDGKVTTDLGGSDYVSSVTVQADRKILLGGTSNKDFALVRYNTDGSLDLGFNGDGIVTTAGGIGNSVATQADGKILLGGTTDNPYSDLVLVRYNSDGSPDNSFNQINMLNNKPSYTENSAPVVLDSTVQIYDTELAAQGNYNGASVTLARHGGANVEDVFSGSGQLSFNGNDGVLSGVIIGTVSNSNGTLTINFNSDATQARVDAVLSSIAYNNTTDNPPTPTDTTPPVSVQIDWIFNDGNTGTQGIGDALTTTGSSIINIDTNLDEVLGTTKNDSIYVFAGRKGYGFTGSDYLNSYSKRPIVIDTDTLVGGKGNDTYVISNKDVVIENQNEGTDTIISRHSIYVLPANVENLTFHLGGQKSFNGKGNDLANTIIGGNRDDRLSGGAGADTLTGGLGADTFKFNKATETGITATTRDTLVDFSHAQGDKINLAAIDANTALKGNNAFAAPTVGGAFSGTFANPGELYFDQSTNILYGNNDADSATDFSIMVMGVSSLVVADFVL